MVQEARLACPSFAWMQKLVERERWKRGLLTDDNIFHKEVWPQPQRISPMASFRKGKLNGTKRTISFEKLSGISIVVAYGHLSWRRGKRNGAKVATSAAPRLPQTGHNHFLTLGHSFLSNYHPLHGTHTSTTLSAPSAALESTM